MQPLFLLLIFLFTVSDVCAKELLLLRNVLIEEPINIAWINALKKKPAHSFRPGDRITAVFMFETAGTEESVEFKWMQQIGRTLTQKEKYTHRVAQQNPGGNYVAYSWVIFDSTFLDKLLGSGYSGDWLVQVYVNNRKEAEKHFTVSPD